MDYYFGILKNETEDDHLEWVNSFEDSSYDFKYKIIDITKDDWLRNVLNDNFDCFLARPPGSINFFKQLYDERLYIINKVLNKKIYPSFEELLIYENKKVLMYWLEANNIPHPLTWIFYHKKDAINFAESCKIPIVAKTSIGAGGSGVKIIKDKEKLKKYIEKAFSKKGITRCWGPNLGKGDIKKRFFSRLSNIPKTIQYFYNKREKSTIDNQKYFVILQEYIKCKFEWRCVRIGNSFFGHKKLRQYGEKFSGTSNVNWNPPPNKLLDFVKYITDKRNFLCQAVDIFEPDPGKFLVNEMQCFWGSKNPHQMIIDGKPGRYILKNSKWIFEEGNFNKNNSYNLRLENVINLLQNNEL